MLTTVSTPQSSVPELLPEPVHVEARPPVPVEARPTLIALDVAFEDVAAAVRARVAPGYVHSLHCPIAQRFRRMFPDAQVWVGSRPFGSVRVKRGDGRVQLYELSGIARHAMASWDGESRRRLHTRLQPFGFHVTPLR